MITLQDKVVAEHSGQFGGLTGTVITLFRKGEHGVHEVAQVCFTIKDHFVKAQFPVSELRLESDNINNFIMF